MNVKRLFLIDCYALIYRSYYAFINTPMYNTKGVNTSTIFGFLLTLDDIIKNQKPTHIAAAFDSSKPTFRHNIYDKYKANRLATPEEIRNAVPVIKKFLQLMNIQIIEYPGYEADDIIGTVAKAASKNEFNVFMVTADKDYCQLVDDKIFIFKPKKSGNQNEIIGVKEIKEKYSIESPEDIIDVLALWGDSTDNIPGVPGIGEKTATKLISKYKSIENLIQNIDEIPPRFKSLIEENIENLKLSKKLVTINTLVPIDFNEEKLRLSNYKNDELKELLLELNFKSLINKIIKDDINNENIINVHYVQGNLFDKTPSKEKSYEYSISCTKSMLNKYFVIHDNSKIEELKNLLLNSNEFCFDIDTTGSNTFEDFIVGLSICFKDHEAYHIPLSKDFIATKEKLLILKEVFANDKLLKVGHNLKFKILFLKRYEVKVKGYLFDTMIAHYILHPEQNHKIDFLAEKYLDYKPYKHKDLIGKKEES